MSEPARKQVQVQYYAVLRDQRGLRAETVITSAGSLRELYQELAGRHGFSLGCDRLRVAANDEFRSWDEDVRDSDRIVFIPPVAGG